MAWLISKAMMKECENSPSLRERVAEYLEESSSDGKQSAPSSGTPTQQAFLFQGKTTAAWKRFPSGMMCRHLTEDLGEDLLMWYREVSLAPTSPAPEREQESTEKPAPCGGIWRESLAKYDPVTHSWRTHQCLLFEDSTECLVTFPRWGMMRGGELYPVEMLVEFIYENESGLSLPTARSCSAMAARITMNTALAKNPNLETVLARLTLPTIAANEGKGSSAKRYLGSKDYHGAKMSEALRICEQDPIYLNPSFAELIMMFPTGWTDLKQLEMPKFLSWQQQHGGF